MAAREVLERPGLGQCLGASNLDSLDALPKIEFRVVELLFDL